jgi:hypothetical protein
MIHSEAKFLSGYKLVKVGKLCASKTQWWDKDRLDIPKTEGRTEKKKVVTGPQVSTKSNPLDPRLRIILFGSMFHSLDPPR